MVRMYKHSVRCAVLIVLLFAYNSLPCKAFSVLTHEAIVDANWDKVILPLLKQKYPGASPDALKEAHAYVNTWTWKQDASETAIIKPLICWHPFAATIYWQSTYLNNTSYT